MAIPTLTRRSQIARSDKFGEGSYVKQAPRFSDQLKDTARNNTFTTLEEFHGTKPHGTPITEHEGMVELDGFLQEVESTARKSNTDLAKKAALMRQNLTFIGDKEYNEATKAIADSWRSYLNADPKHQIAVITKISHQGAQVKSDKYLFEKVLENFTQEERAKFNGRLVSSVNALSAEPSHVKVVMLDDWTISGSQMKSAVAHLFYDESTAKYAKQIEAQFITASPKRLESGLQVSLDTGKRTIPVKAYYQAWASPVSSEYGDHQAHISGTHSTVDYDFRDSLRPMRGMLVKRTLEGDVKMPALAGVQRTYRKHTLPLSSDVNATTKQIEEELRPLKNGLAASAADASSAPKVSGQTSSGWRPEKGKYYLGHKVKIVLPGGKVDDGWEIFDVNNKGEYSLSKTVQGQMVYTELTKDNLDLADHLSSMAEAKGLSPELISTHAPGLGSTAAVTLDNGQIDDGWHMHGVNPDGEYIASKTVNGELLIKPLTKILGAHGYKFGQSLSAFGGSPPVSPEATNLKGDYKPGQTVKVVLDNGKIDGGWVVRGKNFDGAIELTKPGKSGAVLTKTLGESNLKLAEELSAIAGPSKLESFKSLINKIKPGEIAKKTVGASFYSDNLNKSPSNLEFANNMAPVANNPYKVGDKVQVIRSDGYVDHGWEILSKDLNGDFIVTKPSGGQSWIKTVTHSDLVTAQAHPVGTYTNASLQSDISAQSEIPEPIYSPVETSSPYKMPSMANLSPDVKNNASFGVTPAQDAASGQADAIARAAVKQDLTPIVYRGSPAESLGHQSTDAIYFTDSKPTANSYTNAPPGQELTPGSEGAQIKMARLQLKNPYRTNFSEMTIGHSQEAIDKLKAQGYDGVIIDDGFGGQKFYIAFDKTQIHSPWATSSASSKPTNYDHLFGSDAEYQKGLGGSMNVATEHTGQFGPGGEPPIEQMPKLPKVQLPVNGVFEAEPWVHLPGGAILDVPKDPHVFKATVQLYDPQTELVAPQMENTKVFSAHGYVNAQGEWVLRDGRNVEKVIKEYNVAHPNDPIKVAAVCNPEGVTAEIDVPGVIHPTNTTVGVSGFSEDGKLHLRIRLQKPTGSFVMVDKTSLGGSSISTNEPLNSVKLSGAAGKTGFTPGDKVKVVRSNGMVDNGWEVVSKNSDGKFLVAKPQDGKYLTKTVTLADLETAKAHPAGVEVSGFSAKPEGLNIGGGLLQQPDFMPDARNNAHLGTTPASTTSVVSEADKALQRKMDGIAGETLTRLDQLEHQINVNPKTGEPYSAEISSFAREQKGTLEQLISKFQTGTVAEKELAVRQAENIAAGTDHLTSSVRNIMSGHAEDMSAAARQVQSHADEVQYRLNTLEHNANKLEQGHSISGEVESFVREQRSKLDSLTEEVRAGRIDPQPALQQIKAIESSTDSLTMDAMRTKNMLDQHLAGGGNIEEMNNAKLYLDRNAREIKDTLSTQLERTAGTNARTAAQEHAFRLDNAAREVNGQLTNELSKISSALESPPVRPEGPNLGGGLLHQPDFMPDARGMHTTLGITPAREVGDVPKTSSGATLLEGELGGPRVTSGGVVLPKGVMADAADSAVMQASPEQQIKELNKEGKQLAKGLHKIMKSGKAGDALVQKRMTEIRGQLDATTKKISSLGGEPTFRPPETIQSLNSRAERLMGERSALTSNLKERPTTWNPNNWESTSQNLGQPASDWRVSSLSKIDGELENTAIELRRLGVPESGINFGFAKTKAFWSNPYVRPFGKIPVIGKVPMLKHIKKVPQIQTWSRGDGLHAGNPTTTSSTPGDNIGPDHTGSKHMPSEADLARYGDGSHITPVSNDKSSSRSTAEKPGSKAAKEPKPKVKVAGGDATGSDGPPQKTATEPKGRVGRTPKLTAGDIVGAGEAATGTEDAGRLAKTGKLAGSLSKGGVNIARTAGESLSTVGRGGAELASGIGKGAVEIGARALVTPAAELAGVGVRAAAGPIGFVAVPAAISAGKSLYKAGSEISGGHWRQAGHELRVNPYIGAGGFITPGGIANLGSGIDNIEHGHYGAAARDFARSAGVYAAEDVGVTTYHGAVDTAKLVDKGANISESVSSAAHGHGIRALDQLSHSTLMNIGGPANPIGGGLKMADATVHAIKDAGTDLIHGHPLAAGEAVFHDTVGAAYGAGKKYVSNMAEGTAKIASAPVNVAEGVATGAYHAGDHLIHGHPIAAAEDVLHGTAGAAWGGTKDVVGGIGSALGFGGGGPSDKKVSLGGGHTATFGPNQKSHKIIAALNSTQGPGWRAERSSDGKVDKFVRNLYDKKGRVTGTQIVDANAPATTHESGLVIGQAGKGSAYKSATAQKKEVAFHKAMNKALPSVAAMGEGHNSLLNQLGIKPKHKKAAGAKVASATGSGYDPYVSLPSTRPGYKPKEKPRKVSGPIGPMGPIGLPHHNPVTISHHAAKPQKQSGGLFGAFDSLASGLNSVASHVVKAGEKGQPKTGKHPTKSTVNTPAPVYYQPVYVPPPPPPPPVYAKASFHEPANWQHHTMSQIASREFGKDVIIDGREFYGVTINKFKDGATTYVDGNGKIIAYAGGKGGAEPKHQADNGVSVKIPHGDKGAGAGHSGNQDGNGGHGGTNAHEHLGIDYKREAGTDGAPAAYTKGSAVESAYSFTDKKGRQVTITTLKNGERLEQVAGGNAYMTHVPDGSHPMAPMLDPNGDPIAGKYAYPPAFGGGTVYKQGFIKSGPLKGRPFTITQMSDGSRREQVSGYNAYEVHPPTPTTAGGTTTGGTTVGTTGGTTSSGNNDPTHQGNHGGDNGGNNGGGNHENGVPSVGAGGGQTGGTGTGTTSSGNNDPIHQGNQGGDNVGGNGNNNSPAVGTGGGQTGGMTTGGGGQGGGSISYPPAFNNGTIVKQGIIQSGKNQGLPFTITEMPDGSRREQVLGYNAYQTRPPAATTAQEQAALQAFRQSETTPLAATLLDKPRGGLPVAQTSIMPDYTRSTLGKFKAR